MLHKSRCMSTKRDVSLSDRHTCGQPFSSLYKVALWPRCFIAQSTLLLHGRSSWDVGDASSDPKIYLPCFISFSLCHFNQCQLNMSNKRPSHHGTAEQRRKYRWLLELSLPSTFDLSNFPTVLETPGYPDFNSSHACTWKIQALHGGMVKVTQLGNI